MLKFLIGPALVGLGCLAGRKAQWESSLTDEQRQQVSTYQQYEATRPAVDPNAAARNEASGSVN